MHATQCHTWQLSSLSLHNACHKGAPAWTIKARSCLFGAAPKWTPCASGVWFTWGCSAVPRGHLVGVCSYNHHCVHTASLRQWTIEAKNLSSWKATGPSSSETPYLFGCALARGTLLVIASKDSKIWMVSTWLWCLSVPDSGRLVRSHPSACRLWDASSTGYMPSAPASLQAGTTEDRQTLALHKAFPLVQAPGGNQVTVFRDFSKLRRTQAMGRGLSAESVAGESPFPSHAGLQRMSLQRDAVLSRLAFCTTWTAQGWAQDLIHKQGSYCEEHLKALISKTIWNWTVSCHGYLRADWRR